MADDPSLDAPYWAQIAKYEFQKNKTLAGDKFGRTQANAQSAYAKKQLTTSGAQRYAANRNQANAGGLLESGQLAQTQGRTQADYADKQVRIAEQRRAAIAQSLKNDADATEEFGKSKGLAEAEAGERYRTFLETHPPAGDPTGGVVPKVSQQKGGFVRVGYPQRSQNVGENYKGAVRQKAAAKAANRGTPKQKVKTWGVG